MCIRDRALKAENERLAKELAEAKDSYQRMLAEYANYKRRTCLLYTSRCV